MRTVLFADKPRRKVSFYSCAATELSMRECCLPDKYYQQQVESDQEDYSEYSDCRSSSLSGSFADREEEVCFTAQSCSFTSDIDLTDVTDAHINNDTSKHYIQETKHLPFRSKSCYSRGKDINLNITIDLLVNKCADKVSAELCQASLCERADFKDAIEYTLNEGNVKPNSCDPTAASQSKKGIFSNPTHTSSHYKHEEPPSFDSDDNSFVTADESTLFQTLDQTSSASHRRHVSSAKESKRSLQELDLDFVKIFSNYKNKNELLEKLGNQWTDALKSSKSQLKASSSAKIEETFLGAVRRLAELYMNNVDGSHTSKDDVQCIAPKPRWRTKDVQINKKTCPLAKRLDDYPTKSLSLNSATDKQIREHSSKKNFRRRRPKAYESKWSISGSKSLLMSSLSNTDYRMQSAERPIQALPPHMDILLQTSASFLNTYDAHCKINETGQVQKKVLNQKPLIFKDFIEGTNVKTHPNSDKSIKLSVTSETIHANESITSSSSTITQSPTSAMLTTTGFESNAEPTKSLRYDTNLLRKAPVISILKAQAQSSITSDTRSNYCRRKKKTYIFEGSSASSSDTIESTYSESFDTSVTPSKHVGISKLGSGSNNSPSTSTREMRTEKSPRQTEARATHRTETSTRKSQLEKVKRDVAWLTQYIKNMHFKENQTYNINNENFTTKRQTDNKAADILVPSSKDHPDGGIHNYGSTMNRETSKKVANKLVLSSYSASNRVIHNTGLTTNKQTVNTQAEKPVPFSNNHFGRVTNLGSSSTQNRLSRRETQRTHSRPSSETWQVKTSVPNTFVPPSVSSLLSLPKVPYGIANVPHVETRTTNQLVDVKKQESAFAKPYQQPFQHTTEDGLSRPTFLLNSTEKREQTQQQTLSRSVDTRSKIPHPEVQYPQKKPTVYFPEFERETEDTIQNKPTHAASTDLQKPVKGILASPSRKKEVSFDSISSYETETCPESFSNNSTKHKHSKDSGTVSSKRDKKRSPSRRELMNYVLMLGGGGNARNLIRFIRRKYLENKKMVIGTRDCTLTRNMSENISPKIRRGDQKNRVSEYRVGLHSRNEQQLREQNNYNNI